MNEEFNKFKKKILKEHLAKCLIMAISLSAIIVALLFIMFKRIPLDLHFTLYILMFILLSAGSTWLLYKNRMPSDESIAKRLDKTYALNEKIQTMVVCSSEENEILKMQKEDAENSLKNANPKNLSLKLSFINYLALLIAVIFVSTSFFVPAAKANHTSGTTSDNTSQTTSGYEYGSGDETTSGDGEGEGDGNGEGEGQQSFAETIEDLRDLVKNSDAEEKVKQGILDVLDELEEKLENAKDEYEQAQAILDAIEKVKQVVDEANSKEEIGRSLMQEPNLNLYDLGDELIKGNEEGIISALDNLEQEFKDLSGQDLIDDLLDVASQILDALVNSGVSEDDELYMAFNHLLTSLNEIAKAYKDETINEEQAKASIHDAIEKAKEEIIQDIIIQNKNQELGEQVIEALENMLGEPGDEGDPSDGEGENPGEDEDPNGEENPDNPDGGDTDEEKPDVGGDGDTIYGSNDQIFSDKGHSEYGDVLDDYYDRIVDESTNGEVPDDLGEILGDYFGSLYH